jgi:hypothetical protein
MIEIIGILIVAGDGKHAGAQDVPNAMRHQQRVAWVGDQRREAIGDADGRLDGGQQHHTTIRRDASTIERSDDFLAFDGWEIERQECIVQHGGCGSHGCVDWMVSTPFSINAINALRDTRRECPECGGIRRRVVISGPYWMLPRMYCRSPIQTRRCRPRTEPAAASRRRVATTASAVPCSSVD